ncbi:hypothetical protein HDU97_004349 [Phlyctochytrium planicorne]|nr:hypothetical protein HDU97_004349 [Phlyctochytrium planicorne]
MDGNDGFNGFQHLLQTNLPALDQTRGKAQDGREDLPLSSFSRNDLLNAWSESHNAVQNLHSDQISFDTYCETASSSELSNGTSHGTPMFAQFSHLRGESYLPSMDYLMEDFSMEDMSMRELLGTEFMMAQDEDVKDIAQLALSASFLHRCVRHGSKDLSSLAAKGVCLLPQPSIEESNLLSLFLSTLNDVIREHEMVEALCTVDIHGLSALHYAILLPDQFESIKALSFIRNLCFGSDDHATRSMTVLMTGHPRVLTESDIPTTLCIPARQSPLSLALRCRNLDAVRLLVNVFNADSWHPGNLACQQPDPVGTPETPCFVCLFGNPVPGEQGNFVTLSSALSPVHTAVEMADVEALRILIKTADSSSVEEWSKALLNNRRSSNEMGEIVDTRSKRARLTRSHEKPQNVFRNHLHHISASWPPHTFQFVPSSGTLGKALKKSQFDYSGSTPPLRGINREVSNDEIDFHLATVSEHEHEAIESMQRRKPQTVAGFPWWWWWWSTCDERGVTPLHRVIGLDFSDEVSKVCLSIETSLTV